MSNNISQPRRIIRPLEACKRGSFSRATFWRRVKTDPSFPKVFPIGTGARAVGMFEQDFDDWLNQCATQGEEN